MWDAKYREDLLNKREQAKKGGGEKRIQKQHELGKHTARERIDMLFDPGSFVEIESLVESRGDAYGMAEKCIPGDGVIIGYGKVNGRTVYAAAEDFTVMGGTLGEYHSRKICHIMDMALKMKAPYVAIYDSGGARIEEGITSLDGYSSMFYRNTMASGVIPQIAVIMGPCAGGACYAPGLSDFIFMSEQTGHMFITGPKVVKTIMGEDVTSDELGGAKVQSEKSGVVHFRYDDDKSCLDGVKKLLSYLPQNLDERPPYDPNTVTIDNSLELENIVPDNQRKVYDVTKVIESFIDKDTLFEVQKDYAPNIVVGFARLDGEVIGIIANQPYHIGGSLDCAASEKAARFIRFCDCFHIPLLTIEDVPGFLPGTKQEHGGIIRRGAKLLYAYAEATVPKITLITRKAIGGAYICMNSKGMGADVVFAWPIAQTAVLGADGAVDILYGKSLKEDNDDGSRRKDLTDEYEETYMNPYIAAKRGFIDEVILPEETREKIADSFRALKDKQSNHAIIKPHGNIPL
ncbi:acyl-CoA carboxylase subunit beta [Butyrivibrio sp. XPD2006]|uniref:acyl-CoA carboxylase subunit beta n=1 Tax=Butyrivibrio sp. XPD2006 TaxID=1280668 RepID=UPI0003B5C9D1|nr:acyl-CoA carboxylase subunit beta [Butyrivibrio sp. XPD2006]